MRIWGYTNAGEIRNRGFEFSINYNTQIGKDWSINATLTGSTLKNEAVNVGDDIFESSNVDTGYYWDNYSITRNGYPVGSFYGWVVEGIFQNQAEIDAANAAAAAATMVVPNIISLAIMLSNREITNTKT